jgi:hypothetical protein
MKTRKKSKTEKSKHSELMKKLWAEGRFNKRDQSYRKNPNYLEKVSSTVKKRWEEGAYGEERNEKVSKALMGKLKKKKTRIYYYKCKVCGYLFITPQQHNVICKNKFCQKYKNSSAYRRPLSKEEESKRRAKISKTMKGRIPKNLKINIARKNSPRQIEMFNIVKTFFPNAEYEYYVKTKNTKRFLDVAIVDKQIDFEYNGKVHLMKSVKENDYKRTEELEELGWKIVIIDRDNFSQLEEICRNIQSKDYFITQIEEKCE